MPFGIRKKIGSISIGVTLLKCEILRLIMGFEYVVNYMRTCNKRELLAVLKRYGAEIGHGCDIETGLIIHNPKWSFKNLKIGNNCHIGKDSFLDLRDKISVGANVTISMRVIIVTHIDLGSSPLRKMYPMRKSPVVIEDGVYIGANSTILPGVRISSNSFVAAGSLVNHNVETRTLLAGVPAKVVKKLDAESLEP